MTWKIGQFKLRNLKKYIENRLKKLTEPQICGNITKDLAFISLESHKVEKRGKAPKNNGWKLLQFGKQNKPIGSRSQANDK